MRKTSMSDEATQDRLAAKKAAVIGPSPSRSRRSWALGILVLAIAAAGAGYLYFSRTPPAPAAAAHPAGGVVSMPTARFDDGRAHYFEHRQGGVTIRYFVIKSSDGVLRAAFDACDVCWPAGKGYAQEGEFMICRNCGLRFHSNRINEVKGGCNPAPLERRVENGMLLIRVSDILEGRGYFDFSRKG
jgi:uncharacterized membrane protein